MDLTELPLKKEVKDISYQDVLAYFLYGGMIYIGLKNWRRAMDYLTYVCGLAIIAYLIATDRM